MVKRIAGISLAESLQGQQRGQTQAALAETGLLDAGDQVVEQLSTGAADVSLAGRITGEQYGRPTMVKTELRELQQGTKGPLPYFRVGADLDDAGFVELESVDIKRVHPDVPEVFEYDISLTRAGSRGGSFRAVETRPEAVTHPFGSGTDELVGIPATASKVRWMDTTTRETALATPASTVTSSRGDIDRYDLADAPAGFSGVRLIYDVEYATDVRTVRAFDTLGRAEKYDGKGRRQWQSINETQHDITAPVVLSNGRLRIRCEEGASTSAERYNPSAGTEDWSFTTGNFVQSGVAVAGGRVFVGSDDNTVYALDAGTGTEDWSFAAGASVASGVAVDSGTVYVGSDDGTVYALDASTGAKDWEFSTGNAIRSSPAVNDGTVYVGSNDSNVYALDASTGTEDWSFTAGGSVRSGIAVADGTVYAGGDDGIIHALDASTGTEDWSFDTEAAFNLVSDIVVADSTVYVGNDTGDVYALNAGDGTRQWDVTVASLPIFALAVAAGRVYVGHDTTGDTSVRALDASDGSEAWAFSPGAGVTSGIAVADGTVYFGSNGNTLYAVDAATGSERWAFGVPSADVESGIAVTDGRVFLGSDDNTVYAVEREWRPVGLDTPQTILDIDLVRLGQHRAEMQLLYDTVGGYAVDVVLQIGDENALISAADGESATIPTDLQTHLAPIAKDDERDLHADRDIVDREAVRR